MRQDFINWLKAKELKDESIKDYLFYFDKFDFNNITQESIFEFLTSRYKNNVAKAFVKNLKTFLIENRVSLGITDEEATELSLISLPKVTGMKKVRVMNILSEEQIEMIQQKMLNERNKLMLLITYFGGLRVGELVKIKPLDFNWNKWTKNKKVMGELKVLGKGDKERLVILPPNLMLRIAKWINSSQSTKYFANSKLFIQKDGWRDVLKRASMKAVGRKVNPHLLRHSFATNMLKKGFRIEEVQNLLGHTDIKSTTVYLHLSKDNLKDRYMKIMAGEQLE